MGLVIGADHFAELSHKFKHANLQKGIKERGVSFEKSNDQIFVEKVVESLLANGTVCDFVRLKLVGKSMWDFVCLAMKEERDLKNIFEEIMRCVHIKRYFAEFWHFGIEVAREIEAAQFKGIGWVAPLVDCDSQLQFEPIDQLVWNVFLCGAIIEKLSEKSFELNTPLLL